MASHSSLEDTNKVDNPRSRLHVQPPTSSNSGCGTMTNSLTGRRLVDIKHFWGKIIEMADHEPMSCSIREMEFVSEHHRGLQSILRFQCKMCRKSFNINLDGGSKENNKMDVNTAAVSGIVSIGGGFSQLEEFLAVLNVPSMSNNTYANYHATLANSWEKASYEEMISAGKEEAELCKMHGEVDAQGVPLVTVVVDGAWAKRSYRSNYNSLSGVAAIVGYRTRKVLFMGVRNKYCTLCARAKSDGKLPRPHQCAKNWDGTSTAMESDIIVEGFCSSMDMHGVKFQKFIGDGDSSVYKKIQETMPYAPMYVEKIECRNHILRNYSNNLKNNVWMQKGKDKVGSMYSRSLVRKNEARLRKAVYMAIKYRKEQQGSLENRVEGLRKDILNGPYHVFGDHTSCEKYFCTGSKEQEKNHVPTLKQEDIFDKLIETVNMVSKHSSSLIHDVDSNRVEHFNSVIAKFVGGKRVNFSLNGGYGVRCHAAVIQHNTKKLHSKTHMTLLQSSPGVFVKRLERKRSMKRVREKTRIQLESKYKRRKLFTENGPDEDYGLTVTSEKRDVFLMSLRKSDSEKQYLEENTREQGQNVLWNDERRKRLTASNFGKVCKMKKTTNPQNYVKNMLYSIVNTMSMKYGRAKESFAIKDLEDKLKIEVRKCGLFIDREKPFLGATPDGLVDDGGLVEVKCPYVARDMTIEQAMRTKKIKFLTLSACGELILKTNHDYFYQIQGQLHITGRKYCIFVVWVPNDICIQKIERDDKFWKEKMEDKLESFYMNSLLPELLKEI